MSKRGAGDAAAPGVRLDKWLWAARFFKTRSQATAAVNGGKIEVNGGGCKAGRPVHVGDRIEIGKAGLLFDVVVKDLADKRGPASVAQSLYEETAESVARRERDQAMQRAARMTTPIPEGRPDKRDRRELKRFKTGD